ncbi:MAG TPA: pantoate--beta-alanine ligase [Bacteroidia bacterium]|nr:pantoate--beta-alanine ligase [Bacteroidia bacterium]
MQTIKERSVLSSYLHEARKNGSVGFIPTMGALHAGHAALVQRAAAENKIVVASIFVNPTQFNNKNDLAAYPRTPVPDAALLEASGCDLLFLPSIAGMYPENDPDEAINIDLGGLDKVMEGIHRPGHFTGVMQIVKKLFDAVGPCRAYFGEKDYQQLAIIRRMVQELKLPVEIIGCPIVREKDGLAMSSRNARLSQEERNAAPLIRKVLFRVHEMWPTSTVEELESFVKKQFSTDFKFRLEYFEIADADTLQPVEKDQKKNAVACIAVYLGKVRLIDNIRLA